VNRILAYAREALEAIWRNRARSVLTMLGMIIGTASVIAVLGLGQAASHGIAGSLDSFGDPGVYIQIDPKQNDPNAASIQYRDVATILADDGSLIDHLYPAYQRTYRIVAPGTSSDETVSSANDDAHDTLTLAEGRRLSSDDVRSAAHVALMSQPLERKLFREGSGLGRTVDIDGVRFRIIGVYDELKAGIFNNVGGSNYFEIPYSVFHEISPGPIDALQIYPQRGRPLADVSAAVDATLRRIHGKDAQYTTQDALAFVTGFETTISLVSIGITAIGGVALLVAGIGIMNIMLVSVAERTREIGIRKAIGGNRRDIALQFLMESVILSLIGGCVGMAIGIGIAALGEAAVKNLIGPAPIPFGAIVAVAFGFSAAVGIGFGTYPALRAARLDPIEALRS